MESTLTTVNDLKKYTSIGENVDPELLFPHLLIAQQLYVQPVLGDALYNEILNRFDNNQLTGDTQVLYEQYILNAIAYSSWYSSSPFLSYKTNRSGINTTTSDVQTPASIDEFNLYLSKVNNFKDFYLDRLEKYLVANATLFPNFRRNNVKEMNGSSIFLGYKTNPKGASYWSKDYYGNDMI